MDQAQIEKFMRVAMEEAATSLENGLLPVGAVLVVDGKIVEKAHKEENRSYHLDHAEILLLNRYFQNKNISRDVHDIVLFTTLEPCMMCLGTILHLPINTLVYSSRDPFGGGSKILEAEQLPVRHRRHPLTVRGGVLEAETKAIFKTFVQKNLTPYWNEKNTDNPFIRYILE